MKVRVRAMDDVILLKACIFFFLMIYFPINFFHRLNAVALLAICLGRRQL